jgi:hypothetical protein
MIAVAQTAAAIPSRTCCSEDRLGPSRPELPIRARPCRLVASTAKRNGSAGRTMPGLFCELTLRGRTRGLARCDQAFRNGPGTLILTAPKRAARVAKQDLNLLVPLTEKQKTCALYFGGGADRHRSHPGSWHIVAFNDSTARQGANFPSIKSLLRGPTNHG